MEKDKFYILDVGISAINMHDAALSVEDAISSGKKKYICVCPVSTVMECRRNGKVLTSVNSADLATPDGMPLVWLGKMLGHSNIRRVYGPELMHEVCRISEKKGYKNYFYGSSQNVLDRLKDRINKKYPGLVISGMFSPPFRQATAEEDDKIVGDINGCRPDIVWVGLGSPKQDLWMYEHRERISAPLMIGVGAAFDFLAGTKPQAPRWVRGMGFEWFFRLITEPRRLWRRYLVDNTLFVWYVLIYLLARASKTCYNKNHV